MPTQIIFDDRVTPVGNQVVIDPNQNTVKIDPTANIVRIQGSDAPPSPVQYWTSRNAADQVPTPVRASQPITGTALLDPGVYDIEWMVGLVGPARSVNSAGGSNMTLRIGNLNSPNPGGYAFRCVYANSDKNMAPTLQPRLRIKIDRNDWSAQVQAIQDDNNTGQWYAAVVNLTRIA